MVCCFVDDRHLINNKFEHNKGGLIELVKLIVIEVVLLENLMDSKVSRSDWFLVIGFLGDDGFGLLGSEVGIFDYKCNESEISSKL